MLSEDGPNAFAERLARQKERREAEEQARRRTKQANLGTFFTKDKTSRASLSSSAGPSSVFPQTAYQLQQQQESLQAQHILIQQAQVQQKQSKALGQSGRSTYDEDDDRPSLPFPSSGSEEPSEQPTKKPSKKKEAFKLLGPAQPIKISATFDQNLTDAPVASQVKTANGPTINPWEGGNEEEESKIAQVAPVASMPSSPQLDASGTLEWDPADFLPHLLKDWVTKLPPCDATTMIQCRILRKKEGMDRLNPRYELYLEGKQRIFLMAAKRKHRVTLKGKASNYIITIRPMTLMMEKEDCVGKLKSNFLGTVFTLYDDGRSPFGDDNEEASNKKELRHEYGLFLYNSNLLGMKGPRKMAIILPKVNEDQTVNEWKPQKESETIYEQYRGQGKGDQFTELINKTPQWHEQTQAYVLNFRGRVTAASVKNFQIVSSDDPNTVLVQFGRCLDDTFTLDFRYPITALQAFSIALSSFDGKLACE